jgi:hypothetical protein
MRAEGPPLKKGQSAGIDEALRLAEQLLEKPLSWTEPLATEPSDFPVFRFVIFRGYIRAVSQYKSLVLLLKAGQWEDALILGRSLYELDLNLSKISGETDPEAAAKQFVKFGKFLLFRLTQRQLQDGLRDAQLKSQASIDVADCEKSWQISVPSWTGSLRNSARLKGSGRSPGRAKTSRSWLEISPKRQARRTDKATTLFSSWRPSSPTIRRVRCSLSCHGTVRRSIGMTSAPASTKPAATVRGIFCTRLLYVSSILSAWPAGASLDTNGNGLMSLH